MQAMLEAIENAKREIESEPEQASRSSARALLAQARELWRDLESDQRQALGGPARELRALLDAEIEAGVLPTPEDLLKRAGLEAFRPGQRDAVQAALEGRDSLVVMPTGGGKSLCYQLPALTDAGLVVVVSPLIALMSDQLRRLREMGARASMLASGMEDGHNEQALADVRSGKTQLVLMSPERFASRPLRDALTQRRVSLFVVDEAHCVAEWGHDFRPDYLRLGDAIAMLGRPPVMAATATATPAVAREIAERLGLRDWVSIRSGFDRPNLTFDVVSLEGKGAVARKRAALLHVLSDAAARPAIVYCGTRKDTEEVAALVGELGIMTVPYHAGMAPDARRASQEAFMNGEAEVVVATNAFGMGVDKANVRTVAHWALPTSLEAYYQEAGRGGRDGQPARALLLGARMDLGRLIRFINERDTSVEDVDRYLRGVGRQAREQGGAVVMGGSRGAGLDERERVLLSIAERSGAVKLEPAGGGGVSVSVTGRFDSDAAYTAIKVAKDRSWAAYKAIERYMTEGEKCRRRQILDHFGDAEQGAPTGRCCDLCDPDTTLALAAEKATRAAKSTRRAVRGSGAATADRADAEPVDEEQFEKLRAWRYERAEGKPAYTVAPNAVLEEVLRSRPRSIEGLLRIRGIGPSLCEKHGDSLLEALSAL
jgi:ATP-dependent DNA helicase RecQ